MRSLAIAIAFLFAAASHAAISVTGGGTGVLTFDTIPAVTEWSTLNVTGAGNTIQSVTAWDATVQPRAASEIATALGQSATTPPSGNGVARWNSNLQLLQTLPTGNAATLLMATLQNDLGSDATEITITYDMGVNNANSLELPGWRVFYNVGGAANNWQLIPELSDIHAVGTVSATVALPTGWPAGTLLYLAWSDDNADTATDESYTIDNFSVTAIGGPSTPIAITNQPVDQTVDERGTATFTVGVEGSPRSFFWFRDGVQIPGNNSPTFVITNVQYPLDNNSQIYVVVSNSLNLVTSDVVTLTVLPDTTAPTVVSAVGELDANTVTVTFSEAVDVNTISDATILVYPPGEDPFNGLITFGSALGADGRTATFTTDARVFGSNYTILITGVLDASSQQNALEPEPTIMPLTQRIELIGFDVNSEWKYDINNGDRFGTGWETIGYDDSAWPSGPAGLGLDGSVNAVPIVTPLPYSPNSIPVYFRRHFFLPTDTNGVTLSLRHVIEDGAVYYINGQEAARFRAPAGTLTFASRANASAPDPTPIEGPFSLPATNLLPGDNVIAVVVLQSGSASTDIELAVELTAAIPSFSVGAPEITTHPQSQTVNEGVSVTLTASASGAQPIAFQWRKGGQDIPGANSFSYTINPALPDDSGSYDVVATNPEGTDTSDPAVVTVVPDLTAPTFVSAIGQTNLDQIVLTFSEALNIDNAEDVGNYTVALTAGGGALPINGATLVNGTNVVLTTGPRAPGQNYTVTIGNITDNAVAQNVATPNARPVVASVILLAPDDVTFWRYNSESNNLDGLGWELPNFDDSLWPLALAGFTTSNNLEITTNGFELRSTNMLAPVLGGPATVYYRVNFNFPGSTAGAGLSLVGVIDDGIVAYINGVEAGRLRITNASPVSFTNFATTSSPEVSQAHLPLETVVLTNLAGLVQGNNVLAIQLHNNSATSTDTVLAVQLVGQLNSFADLGPQLRITRDTTTGQITVSWSGAGVLQQTGAIQDSGTSWTDVPGNPNPYIFTPGAGAETRFFSLHQ
jgi:hypothetical protein